MWLKLPICTATIMLPVHHRISHLHSVCRRRSHCHRCCHHCRCRCFPRERCFLEGGRKRQMKSSDKSLQTDACQRNANILLISYHIIPQRHILLHCATLKVGYTAHNATKPFFVLLSTVFPTPFVILSIV